MSSRGLLTPRAAVEAYVKQIPWWAIALCVAFVALAGRIFYSDSLEKEERAMEAARVAALPPPPPREPAKPATYVTTGDNLAALSRESFDAASALIAQKDEAALRLLLEIDPTVFFVKRGVRVTKVDSALFSGMVKVRVIGTLTEFWTTIEAVERER